jgi:ABC-type multidrug transport system fused ATPase/permease subunit
VTTAVVSRSVAEFRRPYRGSLSAATALTVAEAVLDLARPWPLAIAVDQGLQHQAMPSWLAPLDSLSTVQLAAVAAAASVFLTLLGAACGYIAEMLVGVAAERIGADLRNALMTRLLGLSLRFHDRHRSTELVSRLTTDVRRTEDSLVVWYESVIPGSLELVGMLLVLLLVDPPLAGVALAVTPVLAIVAIRRRARVRTSHATARAAQGRLAARAGDLLRNVRVIQAFDQNDRAQHEFAVAGRSSTRSEIDALGVERRLGPVADLVLAIGAGLVLCAGVIRVTDGAVSIGTLLVVLSYVASLYGPVRSLTRLSSTLSRGAASRARIVELLDSDEHQPRDDEVGSAPALTTEVALTGVRFGYSPDLPVLRGVDLTVRIDETVAIMGSSGEGKSTLLNLLLRLYDPDSGVITFDGVDVRNCSVASVRRQIALVPQDPWLLDGSIRDNIAFGRPAVTDLDIRLAARTALLEPFVRDLPDGYDAVVGEGGVRLSGGQRRRLALARAVVRDAPVLLLDEPTSGLDAQSATAVMSALRRASTGRATLLVTHDPAVAALADRVVVLDGGRIENHGAARRRNGRAASLESSTVSTTLPVFTTSTERG